MTPVVPQPTASRHPLQHHDFNRSNSGDLAADLRSVLYATVDAFNDLKFQAPYRALAVVAVNDAKVAAEFTGRLLEPGIKVYAERLGAPSRPATSPPMLMSESPPN